MRRIVSLLFAAATLLSMHAQTFAVDDISYTVNGENTVAVTDYTGSATDVVIPQTVENDGITYTVTVLGEYCFKWNSVVNVTLPPTITRIEWGAFHYSDLASINFPEGLEYIGGYAFYSMDLTEIDIPATVDTIGPSAFAVCSSLTSVTLHEGLKSIGQSAFYKCAITSIDVPEGIEELDRAFLSCDQLTEAKLPSTLRKIGPGTFNGCTQLGNLTLPEGLEEIGYEAFLGCKAMTEITIPSTVTEIGNSIIGKSSIATINVASGNQDFHVVDGALYSMDNRVLYAIPMVGVTSYKVHDSCVGIKGGAAWGSELESVTMSDDVLIVDEYAFRETPLTSVTMSKHLTYIGEKAFSDTKLVDLVVGDNVLYIGDGAFARCTSLQTISLPSGLQAIDFHAFYRCTALQKVTSWGSVAPQLPDLYDVDDSPFYKVSTSTPLYVPRGCTQSYKDAAWSDYLTINEMEQGILQPISIDPADSTTVGKNQPMSFIITFDEPVSVVTANPDVLVKQESLYYGNIFTPDDAWYINLSSDKKSITVWAADYDSFVMTYDFADNQTYYIVFPAGMVQNDAGDMNEKIVLTLLGNKVEWELGDVNHDGIVDVNDVTKLITRVLATGKIDDCFDSEADLNGDGIIDVNDVTALINLVLSK